MILLSCYDFFRNVMTFFDTLYYYFFCSILYYYYYIFCCLHAMTFLCAIKQFALGRASCDWPFAAAITTSLLRIPNMVTSDKPNATKAKMATAVFQDGDGGQTNGWRDDDYLPFLHSRLCTAHFTSWHKETTLCASSKPSKCGSFTAVEQTEKYPVAGRGTGCAS